MLTSTVSVGFADIAILSVVSSLIKILLIPSYFSTDFEVHRNWLAITFSLPINKWYYEDTSEWTLDYPPFFAWFEYLLAKVAQFFDPGMLNVKNLKYDNISTIYFQRLTRIIFSFEAKEKKVVSMRNKLLCFSALVIFNAGLFIVDHIHFQYNGFLFGILFISVATMMEEKYILSSLWFCVLLNMKHIFLYIAPAYGIFLLRFYCMNPKKGWLECLLSLKIQRLFYLAAVVLFVFSLSFLPFMNDIPQVLSRLFPFKRGLTHAYWAPNVWALYNAADVVLTIIGNKFGFIPRKGNMLSRGLVGEFEFNILPQVPPAATALITLLAMMPCLMKLWISPNTDSKKNEMCQFLRAVTIMSMCSFLFGWHVHEKAILMVILPLTILMCVGTSIDGEVFILLQAVGHYSLFPLLFTRFDNITKTFITVTYATFSFISYRYMSRSAGTRSSFYLHLSSIEIFYLFCLVLNEIYCSILHWFLPYLKQYEFLPLMLTSTICAIGIIWCWIKLYYVCLFMEKPETMKKKRQKLN